MKIPLTKNQFAIVDKEDFKVLNQFKWHYSGVGYAARDVRENKKYKKIAMHRFLMNPPEGMIVDHINSNKLDNRRSNLRICTQKENVYNSKSKGYSKVTNRPLKKPYAARIMFNYKQIHLGYFATAREAQDIHNIAAKKYFGEFAKMI